MSKNQITLHRYGMQGFLSSNDIGTDALNAMNAIPNVQNSEIVKESESSVTIEYEWHGKEQFMETDEHLAKYGLERLKENAA